MKNILYIGRFQPFHLGHIDAIRQIYEQYKNTDFTLYIGIGSAENNFTMENPLTAGERFEMIKNTMNDFKLMNNYYIVPIRNINHYELWPVHVQQYLPEIDILYSGSSIVKQLWKRSFPNKKVADIDKRESVSASDIRMKIIHNKSIKNLVSSNVLKFLENIDFYSRINNLKTA
jgi:nicotinamide-nucleotide adenylyltransferase